MNSQDLQQLKSEIKQELIGAIKNSKLSDILQNYDLIEDGILQFKCMLDLKKIQLTDAVGDEKVETFSQAIPLQNMVMDCTLCPPDLCCP